MHPLTKKAGAFSSVGLEHLPYKQRVGGSNPSTPTLKGSFQSGQMGQTVNLLLIASVVRIHHYPQQKKKHLHNRDAFFILLSEDYYYDSQNLLLENKKL